MSIDDHYRDALDRQRLAIGAMLLAMGEAEQQPSRATGMLIAASAVLNYDDTASDFNRESDMTGKANP